MTKIKTYLLTGWRVFWGIVDSSTQYVAIWVIIGATLKLWGVDAMFLSGAVLLLIDHYVEKLKPKNGTTIHMHVDGDIDLTEWKANQ